MKVTLEFDSMEDALAALGRVPVPTQPTTDEPAKPAPARRGRPAAVKPEPAPAPAAPVVEPEPEGSFLDDDEPTAKLTKDDVRAALVELQLATDEATAKGVLTSVGGTEKLGALAEDKYAAVVAAAKAKTPAKK